MAFYLNKYLGNYVYGLDPQSLKISVFKGDVQLNNLHLKPEALNALNLPITVKAGLLGSLTLKVCHQADTNRLSIRRTSWVLHAKGSHGPDLQELSFSFRYPGPAWDAHLCLLNLTDSISLLVPKKNSRSQTPR